MDEAERWRRKARSDKIATGGSAYLQAAQAAADLPTDGARSYTVDRDIVYITVYAPNPPTSIL